MKPINDAARTKGNPMNRARIGTIIMQCIVVVAVIVVGYLVGGFVTAVALGAGASVAVFRCGAYSSRSSRSRF